MLKLAPHTTEIFKKAIQLECIKPYYLVGGTALSLQLGTRLSEDLDFMRWRTSKSEKMEVPWNQIKRELSTIGEVQSMDIIDIDHVLFSVSGVKFSFYACDKYSPLKDPVNYLGNLKLADVFSIGVMKMEVMLRRSNFRDYYDLYSIIKSGIDLNDLIHGASEYSSHQLKTKNIISMLTKGSRFKVDVSFDEMEPIYNITASDIEKFFYELLKNNVASKQNEYKRNSQLSNISNDVIDKREINTSFNHSGANAKISGNNEGVIPKLSECLRSYPTEMHDSLKDLYQDLLESPQIKELNRFQFLELFKTRKLSLAGRSLFIERTTDRKYIVRIEINRSETAPKLNKEKDIQR